MEGEGGDDISGKRVTYCLVVKSLKISQNIMKREGQKSGGGNFYNDPLPHLDTPGTEYECTINSSRTSMVLVFRKDEDQNKGDYGNAVRKGL